MNAKLRFVNYTNELQSGRNEKTGARSLRPTLTPTNLTTYRNFSEAPLPKEVPVNSASQEWAKARRGKTRLNLVLVQTCKSPTVSFDSAPVNFQSQRMLTGSTSGVESKGWRKTHAVRRASRS